jgi:hypothetical protein
MINFKKLTVLVYCYYPLMFGIGSFLKRRFKFLTDTRKSKHKHTSINIHAGYICILQHVDPLLGNGSYTRSRGKCHVRGYVTQQ